MTTPDTPSFAWLRRHSLVLLVVGILAAMAVCLWIGLRQSVWFDEAYSITLAKGSLADIVRYVSVDTHPPLYYFLLKAWGSLFGWSELALRSLGVLMMGGMLFVGGLLVKRLFGLRAFVVTAALMVVSPFVIRYGFEIRMYSLAGLIGVSATYVLLRARQARPSRQWWWYTAYVALVTLGMYTLYYLALLWVAHCLWLLWEALRHRRVLLREPWVRAYALVAVLFLPWLPVFLSQLGNGALTPVAQQMTALQMIGIVSFWFLYTPAYLLTGATSLIVLWIIVVGVWLVQRGARLAGSVERAHLFLFGLYALVPAGLIALVSLARPMYIERYLSHVMIGALIVLGVSLAIVMRRHPRVAMVSICLLVATSLGGVARLIQVGNYNYQRIELPSGRQVAAQIRSHCQDSTIIFNGAYIAIDESYYFAGCPTHVLLSDNPEFMGGYALLHDTTSRVAAVQALGDQTRAIFVHYSDDAPVAPAAGYRLADSVQFNKVVIDTYER